MTGLPSKSFGREPMTHIRPADRLAPCGADQVEGRVMRVDRDGLLVDWGGRLGTVRPSVG